MGLFVTAFRIQQWCMLSNTEEHRMVFWVTNEGENSLQVELKAGSQIEDEHAFWSNWWHTSNFVIVGGIIWIILL
jgi:hypothetical protein